MTHRARIQRQLVWLATLLCVVAMPRPALADDGVGVVAEYRPAAGRFSFQRAGAESPVPVRIGTLVMANDRLTLPAGSSVVVLQGDGQQREFAGPGTYDIPATTPLGKVGSVFRSIMAVFDDEYRLAGTAASRGGEDCRKADGEVAPIEVPILAGSPAIVAGTRDVPLAWVGGCTPFEVSLQSADGQTLYRESVEGRQVRLDDVPLAVGRYQIVITDSSGVTFKASVDSVTATPAMPAEIAADASSLGVVAGAVWLAGQDAGRWRFDSFERLRPLIRAGDPLAGAIGDGVLWGNYSR